MDRGDVFTSTTRAQRQAQRLRRGKWKLHRSRMAGPYFTARDYATTAELPQLFDLDVDEEESYDVSDRHPRLVEELLARMAEFDAQVKADHAARYPGS